MNDPNFERRSDPLTEREIVSQLKKELQRSQFKLDSVLTVAKRAMSLGPAAKPIAYDLIIKIRESSYVITHVVACALYGIGPSAFPILKECWPAFKGQKRIRFVNMVSSLAQLLREGFHSDDFPVVVLPEGEWDCFENEDLIERYNDQVLRRKARMEAGLCVTRPDLLAKLADSIEKTLFEGLGECEEDSDKDLLDAFKKAITLLQAERS